MILKPFQREALAALEMPGHVICVAATGSGKSLVYERAIAAHSRRALLVSPLVALSRQQRAALKDSGLRCIGASLPRPGERGVWIASPEALSGPGPESSLRDWKPDFLVVDECHCIWDWGETFRPAFSFLPRLARELGVSRSLWLTATLPPAAREQLRRELPSPLAEIGRFSLPDSLVIRVAQVPWPSRLPALVQWVRARREPGVVFAPTREMATRLACALGAAARRPESVACYHAGLSREERLAIERGIAAGDLDLVVATSAFGMGIHQPRFRWTALWQAPSSLLALAQHLGRAGRDSSGESVGIVFWDEPDFRLAEWTLQGSDRRKEELLAVRGFLTRAQCRRSALIDYFEGDDPTHYKGRGARFEPQIPCMRCDHCLQSRTKRLSVRVSNS